MKIFPIDTSDLFIFQPDEDIKLVLYDSALELAQKVCPPRGICDGEIMPFSPEDLVRQVEETGHWCFCDSDNLIIHLWAKRETSVERLAHIIGAELGSLLFRPVYPDTEDQVPDLPDGITQEVSQEEEADAFGWLAAQSYRWATSIKLASVLFGGSQSRTPILSKHPPLTVVSTGEKGPEQRPVLFPSARDLEVHLSSKLSEDKSAYHVHGVLKIPTMLSVRPKEKKDKP